MKVALGLDHRGRRFKDIIIYLLSGMKHSFVDLDASSDDSSDYPDFAFRVAEAVSRSEADRGILICGTGIGMCIAANKVFDVRAALVYDEETAWLSRAHNDTNVLCISEKTAAGPLLERLMKIWLTTDFAGERHERRVNKIKDYERKKRQAQR